MAKGNGRRKKNKTTYTKRKYTMRQGQLTLNGLAAEPQYPTCHIERGSGGDIRYSVRVPGLTADQAREEAQRQFDMLKSYVDTLKGGQA